MYNFVHIPKCAGQSMAAIASHHPDKITIVGADGYLGHTRAFWQKYPDTFTLVSDPYKRIVDAYFYFVKNKDLADHLPFASKIIKQYPSFEKFVMGIDRDGLLMDYIPHIKPMYFWAGTSKKVMVNKVFKIEDYEIIDAFLNDMGIDQKFSETFVNISPHKHHLEYMTYRIVKEINKLYADDFRLFNYSML